MKIYELCLLVKYEARNTPEACGWQPKASVEVQLAKAHLEKYQWKSMNTFHPVCTSDTLSLCGFFSVDVISRVGSVMLGAVAGRMQRDELTDAVLLRFAKDTQKINSRKTNLN